jgi:hypothetical protein
VITKACPIEDILGVVTGRPFGEPLRILNWMTGGRPAPGWRDFASASRRCREHLLDQHPFLGEVIPLPAGAGKAAVYGWLAEQAQRFGDALEVARIPVVIPEQEQWAA